LNARFPGGLQIARIATHAILIASLAQSAVAPAAAAKITVQQNRKQTCAIVRVKGDLKAGDLARFGTAILPLRRAIVEFESGGGTIFDGVFIGKMIRGYGFWTTVRARRTCASACALAWLGGSKRFIEKRGRIGFHTAYVKHKRRFKHDREANVAIGDYMKALGLTERAVTYATSAEPLDMKWLTKKDALRVGIDVIFGTPPNRPPAVALGKALPAPPPAGMAAGDERKTGNTPDGAAGPEDGKNPPLARVDGESLCGG
jgi:hypothetical protein